MLRRFALIHSHGTVNHSYNPVRETFDGAFIAVLGRCFRIVGGRRGRLGAMDEPHTYTEGGTIVRRSESMLGCRVQ